jgi:hypothetical protein
MSVSNRNSSFLGSYELLLKHLQYIMLVHWSIRRKHGHQKAKMSTAWSKPLPDPRRHCTSTKRTKVFSCRSQGAGPLFKMLMIKSAYSRYKKRVLCNKNKLLKCEHLYKNTNFPLSYMIGMEEGVFLFSPDLTCSRRSQDTTALSTMSILHACMPALFVVIYFMWQTPT